MLGVVFKAEFYFTSALYCFELKDEYIGYISPADTAQSTVPWAKRKNYIITEKGGQLLKREYERLKRQISDGEKIMEELK